MKIEEKRDLIAKGTAMLTDPTTAMNAKDVIMRLTAGWMSDITNSPEGQAIINKISADQLAESVSKMTNEQLRQRVVDITMATGQIMKSGMELFNINNDLDTDAADLEYSVRKHTDLLESVFDTGSKTREEPGDDSQE